MVLASILCLTIWMYGLNEPPATLAVYQLHTTNSSYSHPLYLLPKDDYFQLIDLNFTFRILNLPCNESNPLLLVLVHSSPENFAKRNTIRETWGKNDNEVKILFVTGATNNSSIQKKIDMENRSNGDFIQGSFLDAYRNMTYKHVMVLKYAVYHCPHVKYILKTDDDVFVHMPAMKNFLTNDLSSYGASKVLFCTIRKNTKALRSYRSKWRVSFSEYPEKYYPTYCPGWTLLYSPDIVFHLYKEAQRTDYFWIDDIHITGILTKKLNIVHTDIEPLVISRQNLKYVLENSHNITEPFLYGRSDLDEDAIRALWRYATTHTTPKYILKNNH